MPRKSIPLPNPQLLGERLKDARIKAGKTQGDAGEALGVSGALVGDWERGRLEPPIGGLLGLAKLYDVTPDYLLGTESSSPARKESATPPAGYDLVRLPRGDNQPLNNLEADLLEKTIVILRAEGEAEHFAQSLASNVNSFHRGVLVTSNQAGEPGQIKAKRKVS